ncbi:hypothetical protein SB757_29120, partial [Pseudomonas sp. SIMBA_065]
MQSLHDLLPNKEESDAIFSLPEGGDAAQWEARFARGWQAFSQGEQPRWIRRSILQSWNRSHEHGIDPVSFEYSASDPTELAAVL